jgi:hypothetical protein
MDKNLLNNTDRFFLDHLENYSEEPGKQVWEAIDKRLSEKENTRRAIFGLKTLSISALIIFCLSIPFLLPDTISFRALRPNEKTINQKPVTYNNASHHKPGESSEGIKELNNNAPVVFENKNMSLSNSFLQKDFPVTEITLWNSLNSQVGKNAEQPGNLHEMQLFFDAHSTKNKTVADQATSTTIHLPNKHEFSIMPFFSIDHISGRFIEQYEFDNQTEDDYSKREKPDMSYTAGVLGSYQLNKKFSLRSGISFSSSMLSITGTAVNALRDAGGKYKFKLATSYGLAEISRSGIEPMAGDSLLVSGATMQFSYLSFPVLVNYDLTGKKLKLAVHGGLALNNVVSEKMEVNYNVQSNEEAETINKIEGIRSVFFTLNTGVEARYSLNHKTDVSISPELRYGINAINKGTPIKTYPVNYGLSFSLYIKL